MKVSSIKLPTNEYIFMKYVRIGYGKLFHVMVNVFLMSKVRVTSGSE